MKLREAEIKYSMELVDRTHLSENDIKYWLDHECQIIGNEIFCNEGIVGIISKSQTGQGVV